MVVRLSATLQTKIPSSLVNVQQIIDNIERVQNKYLLMGYNKAITYPAPTGGKYKRTNTLRDSWRLYPSRIERGAIVGRCYTRAVDKRGRGYAKYIYGQPAIGQRQVVIMRDRWTKQEDLIDRAAYQKEVADVVKNGIFKTQE